MAQPMRPGRAFVDVAHLGPPTITTASTAEFLPAEPEVAPVSGAHDLEACAAEILAMLPKHIAEYVREIAYVHNRQPLWSIVAGHLLKAYENGDIQAPLLDPSWPRRFTDLPADPSTQTYTCAWPECAKEFVPKRYKQRFCSNECGTAAQAAVFAAAKKA